LSHEFCLRMTYPLTEAGFRVHARAEMKCAASPGGTSIILLPLPALSTAAGIDRFADSN
jgi:hypothetical protein